MNHKYIVLFLLIFSLSGCKDKGKFIAPYFEKILDCMEEDHSYLEKFGEHRFELSDDEELFKGGDPLVPNVVFNEDKTDMCADVKIKESWWNSLPDYPSHPEADEESKDLVVKFIFSLCLTNHITGGKSLFDEDLTGEEALSIFEEYEKIGEKCGPDAIPIPLSDKFKGLATE